MSYPTAGMARRLMAMLYDSLIVLALWMLGTLMALPLAQGEAFSPHNPLYTAYLLAISFCFFGWFWTHGGQTLGMRAWRLSVQQTRQEGNSDGKQLTADITLQQAALRFLVAIPSILLAGLGFFYMLFNRNKLTIYDQLSNTQVVVLPKQRR